MTFELSLFNDFIALVLVVNLLAITDRLSPFLTLYCCQRRRFLMSVAANFSVNCSTLSVGINKKCGPSGSVAQRLNPGFSLYSSVRVMSAMSAASAKSICDSILTTSTTCALIIGFHDTLKSSARFNKSANANNLGT